MAEIVSGMGADSKRTDKNISSRVAKIQREAKIQNATGGSYGESQNLTALAQGASTNVPTSSMPGAMPTSGVQLGRPRTALPDIFSQGNPNLPDTDGAGGLTAGRSPSDLAVPVASPNELSVLARAIYASNPTPIWRRVVEAFDEEGL